MHSGHSNKFLIPVLVDSHLFFSLQPRQVLHQLTPSPGLTFSQNSRGIVCEVMYLAQSLKLLNILNFNTRRLYGVHFSYDLGDSVRICVTDSSDFTKLRNLQYAPISSNEDFCEHFQVPTCSMALNQPSSVNSLGSCAHGFFVLLSAVSPGTTLHDCTIMCPRFKWTMTFPYNVDTKHNISQPFLW